MSPPLTQFADFSLLALRLMVGLVLITSGWNHVTKSDERSKSIGMSKGFRFSGGCGNGGSSGRSLRSLYTACRTGVILVMLGAIEKKIFVWHTGFWGAGTMT